MQWHEDSFDLPEGAALLAAGDACRNQIFRMGGATYGFQCHIEVDAYIARSWVRLRAAESGATDAAFSARFEEDLERHLGDAMAYCRTVTRRWTALAAGRNAR
jgi:GMP synthase (glutamine-hydrolysing)